MSVCLYVFSTSGMENRVSLLENVSCISSLTISFFYSSSDVYVDIGTECNAIINLTGSLLLLLLLLIDAV